LPTSNDIRNILDIQDKNILFEDNCVDYNQYKGKKCKFIKGTLTYTPTECRKCQAPNTNYSLYRNGTQTSRITLPMSGSYPTYLLLRKQRFICKACGSSFTAKTPIVKKYCFVGNTVKAQVLGKTGDAQSIKDIARDCAVSHATVQRVIHEEVANYKPHYHALPANLSFDEFKYKSGEMAFEYIDAETGDIVDVLPSRDGRTIKNHFISRYSLDNRRTVQTITVDMNAGYIGLIPALFPNAKIIIDRFHLVQLINRSMNQTRVRIMNQFNTSNGEDQKRYRRLKKYWKKLLKKASELSYTTYGYYPMFGQRLESTIVSEMLDYDSMLDHTYSVYQSLLKAIEDNDYARLKDIVYKKHPEEVSSFMKKSLKTLKKHLSFIQHTFTYPFNNGRIEGINNKIKVLNRVSYGYRNFINYKNRIILHFNMKPRKKKKKETHSLAA